MSGDTSPPLAQPGPQVTETLQEALRERERYLHAILQTTADGFWVIDRLGRVIEVNGAYCTMSGYSREELLSLHLGDLDAVETPAQTIERIGRVIRNGSEVFETRHRRKDGTSFPVEVSATFMPDHGGQFVCFCRDLSERKRAEERVALMAQMLDEAPAAITIHDASGGFLYANRATFDLHGYPDPAEFMARTLHDLDVPDYEALIPERMRRIREDGQAQFEVVHFRRDGSTFPLDVLAKSISWHGQPAVLSVAVDASGRQAADREREQLHERLSQAERMESIGRLAGGVAHDFNNMLGAILGHTELALGNLSPADPLHADLVEIRAAADRSADLTRQLLAFARRQTAAPRVLDLNATVASLLNMLRRLIGEGIDLVWVPGEAAGAVRIDPSQVDQILVNLCVNARDAIRDTGRITIATGTLTADGPFCAAHPGAAPGAYVTLAVGDTGGGMDDATRAHLFEPFFTTKTAGVGTGLGLATVYGIVQQNLGFITVDSEVGRGSVFTIHLPRQAATDAAAAVAAPAVQAEPGHETILLVEDEPAILRMTETMLTRQGYRVLPAGTPGEAMRIAREHGGHIHLVVTDVIMPEMNGRDLATALLSLYPDLKRLFMSGYTADVIAHHGVLEPGIHFIQKPFSMRQLGEEVRAALDGR